MISSKLILPAENANSERSSYAASSVYVTDSQLINKTEEIFESIARILIYSNWSVSSVFGHPDILEIIPEYEGK
jgi:hypothetical protein